MNRRTLLILLAALAAGAAFGFGQTPPGKTIAITNVKIVPVSGADLASGTILIRDGKIADIGPGIAVPSGAEVVEGKGLTAFPGMIDGYSFLGLQEITGVNETVDNRETGRINPQVWAVEALRYDSMHIPIARSNGITAAIVAPTGGLISGRSVLIKLDGWTNREMVVKNPAALQIEFPEIRSGRGGAGGFGQRGGGGGAQDAAGMIAELKELFAKARAYERRKAYAKKNLQVALPDFDETSEFLLPVLKGEVAVMISVHAERDIQAAIKFVKEEGLKAVFYGAEQGWKVADDLKASGIPVVISPLYASPPVWDDGYDQLFMNAVRLSRAGVKIAFSSGSATAAKDLPYHAAKAAAFGLDRREALRAVTLSPAEIFGVAGEMGSLEKGKTANIVLADGDILEMRTNIKSVFIDGKPCDMSNRYTELLEKFKKR
jgi:imidazolonepropionase-like amidohydrolase